MSSSLASVSYGVKTMANCGLRPTQPHTFSGTGNNWQLTCCGLWGECLM